MNSNDGQRHVRPASESDIDYIWAIDSSATKKFGSIPALADLAASEESPEKFESWLNQGRVYLVEERDAPVGFVAAHEVNDVLHINEIGVHEDHQGKGIGALLLQAIFEWGQDIARQNNRDVARVSLTTYADVAWNGPWYKKHGFRKVEGELVGPWHAEEAKQDVQNLARPGYRRCFMLWEKKVVGG
ncbi:hypothetical protein H2200_008208 [Cladophialophora chaetospira]|uniref:N-acetyltransferase domain-containing protein n=1 Tax=Cladophialophora chaetospira TaxID=386627 RepID=A0AA39CGD0_9EURO|nr:hypothetical protein H2200_008208 [Cladophialophora chaetospira]